MKDLPEPFLTPILDKNSKPYITEGWLYSDEEVALHGTKVHQSVDFAVPIGTPVLATSDGVAIATFGEQAVMIDNDQKTWKGLPIYFGFGLVIQILHENGWFTYYGHLHKLIPEFEKAGAYYEPILQKNGDLYTNNLYESPEKYGSSIKAINVTRGQIIGYSGITGMGWGVKTYHNWIKVKPYKVCDEEHLHFQLAKHKTTNQSKIYNIESIDPFGIYATFDKYPNIGEDWINLEDSIWLKGM